MSKVEKNNDNFNQCFCLNCPSYNECAKEKTEKLYCSEEIGKSACDYKMNGCLCGGCPVYKNNNLKTGYYCLRGSADKADNKK